MNEVVEPESRNIKIGGGLRSCFMRLASEVIFYRARRYDIKGQLERASTLYEQALEYNPDNPRVLLNAGLSRCRLVLKRDDSEISLEDSFYFVDQAVKFFKRFTEIKPDDAIGFNNLAMARYLRNKILRRVSLDSNSALITDIEEAIRKDPDNPYILYNKAVLCGYINTAMTDKSRGVPSIEEALTILDDVIEMVSQRLDDPLYEELYLHCLSSKEWFLFELMYDYRIGRYEEEYEEARELFKHKVESRSDWADRSFWGFSFILDHGDREPIKIF